jgi:hypothetical protein
MTKQQLFIEKCTQLQTKLRAKLTTADDFDKVCIQEEINVVEYFKYNKFKKIVGFNIIYN